MQKLKKFSSGFVTGMKNFGVMISTLVNTILLSVVYIFGVGLTCILAKLKRKSFLQLDFSAKESYWVDLNLQRKPIKEYYKQF